MFWQAGVFYFDSEFSVTTSPFFVPPTTHRHENTAWAIFGQVSYDVSDRFNLTAGLRWTDDDKTTTIDQANYTVVPNPIKVDDAKASWDLSGAYTVSDQINLYARVASGFRGPSVQARDVAFTTMPTPGVPSVADSETILSGEIGIQGFLYG